MRRWIDIHAHILPGVDDGSRTMEETRLLLKSVYEQGARAVIATPHYAEGRKNQSAGAIRQAVGEVRREASEIAPELEIFPGQEILYFHELAEALRAGEVLTLADTRYVLIEFPTSVFLRDIEQAVRTLVLSGYQPVLAHVERYGCLRAKGTAEALEALIQGGARLQMNFTSLQPAQGHWDVLPTPSRWRMRREVHWCRRMAEDGMIQFFGTDMHRTDYRPPKTEAALGWLEKKLGEEELERLLWDNPQRLLRERQK